MAKIIVMPKFGLTMTEGTLSKWYKKRATPSPQVRLFLTLKRISSPTPSTHRIPAYC